MGPFMMGGLMPEHKQERERSEDDENQNGNSL